MSSLLNRHFFKLSKSKLEFYSPPKLSCSCNKIIVPPAGITDVEEDVAAVCMSLSFPRVSRSAYHCDQIIYNLKSKQTTTEYLIEIIQSLNLIEILKVIGY